MSAEIDKIPQEYYQILGEAKQHYFQYGEEIRAYVNRLFEVLKQTGMSPEAAGQKIIQDMKPFRHHGTIRKYLPKEAKSQRHQKLAQLSNAAQEENRKLEKEYKAKQRTQQETTIVVVVKPKTSYHNMIAMAVKTGEPFVLTIIGGKLANVALEEEQSEHMAASPAL